ncbi:MAG: VOC family protein [Deltaproteobacteria bacterium]|nr:VOC family protein [Deltaproteobacteria bacterium]
MLENNAPPEMHLGNLPEELPGFLFVDHIAIAVPRGSLEAQIAAYEMLGFREVHREEVLGGDQVREVLLQIGQGPSLLQLLEPLNEDSPVQKALDRNGGKGGLNHVGFRVSDIRVAFEYLRHKGFRIIDKAPRPGSRGTMVFFLHPKTLPATPLDVLIEVVQEKSAG